MHTLHQFQALFGTFTRCPRRVQSQYGNWWILIDCASGSYDFPSVTDLRYAVAIEDASGYETFPF